MTATQPTLTHVKQGVSPAQFQAMLRQDPTLETKEKPGETLVFRSGTRVARFLPIQQALHYIPRNGQAASGESPAHTCATCIFFKPDHPDLPQARRNGDYGLCLCPATSHTVWYKDSTRCPYHATAEDDAALTPATDAGQDQAAPWPARCPDCGGEMRVKLDEDREPFWSCKKWDGPRPRPCEGRTPFTLHPDEQAEWEAFIRATPHTTDGALRKRAKLAELRQRSIARLPQDARPFVPQRRRRSRLPALGFGG